MDQGLLRARHASLEALAAYTGVSLRAVATTVGVELLGFADIRVTLRLDTDADDVGLT